MQSLHRGYIRGRHQLVAEPEAAISEGTAMASPIDLQKHLKGVDYPASKDDLVRTAEEEGAGEDVVAAIRDLPGDSFDSPADVSKAFGNAG